MKREGCIVMLAFLGGIVLTNLLGANQQIHGQLLNQTFLQQYAYQKVDGNQLFGHVVMVRMPVSYTHLDVYKRQLLLFVNAWSVGMVLDRNEGLVLSEFGRE